MAKYSGLFGNVPTEQLMGQPQPRSGGFFGQGGGGRAIAGSIGDALLQMAHMQPIYAPTMQAQQKAALEDAQWTRRQQSELANQQAMYDYKLAHPDPGDDAFTRALSLAGIDPTGPDGQRLARQRAEALAADPNDAFVATSLPGDRFYAGPKSGLAAALGAVSGGAPAGVQEGATATNPQTGEKLIFRGGQWQPMGGTGGNVSGGFPQ